MGHSRFKKEKQLDNIHQLLHSHSMALLSFRWYRSQYLFCNFLLVYLIHFVCFIFRFSNFLGNGVWGSFSFSLYKFKMVLILKNNLFLGFADLSLSFIVWPQVLNFDSVSHSLTASLHAFRSA